MAYTMETLNSPEGLTTTTTPDANPFRPDTELSGFLRDMALRRARGADRPSARPRRGLGANASGPRPTGRSQGHDNTSDQANAIKLRMLQAQEQDANSVRNMRKVPVPMGPGGMYGVAYDWDLRGASPLQQQAVSPQNASFEGAGAFNPTAKPQGADEDWLRFLQDVSARRAIDSNGGF